MITLEQKQKIATSLKGRNLPLDLFVEIEDHMSEQVEYKMREENKDFETALNETLFDWKIELGQKYAFFANQRRTRIHRSIVNETQKKILLKGLMYFAMPFIFGLVLLFTNKDMASFYILSINIFVFVAGFVVCVKDFKLMKTATRNNKRKISYLQKGASLLTITTLSIPPLILFGFEGRFDKFYLSFQELINGDLTIVFIATFITYFGYFYASICGFLYYLEYKKTIKVLEQKIDFKL